MLGVLEVQEEYIKDEQHNLKKEYLHAQEEVKRIQFVPLVIGQFLKAIDQNTVDVIPPEADSSSSMLQANEKPDVTYTDIGEMDMQKEGIREVVELPLTYFQLYKQIGIDPPPSVLMYGSPGCGKMMLAKTFVQKYLGEVSRMVRDVFRL